MMSWYGWRPYVPVALRRVRAAQKMEKLRKKGLDVRPVKIEGRRIARTFWGQAWCDHLESFSDFENRLPRGRTYVRNGSVCHLDIAKGEINAMVSGSELYKVKIAVQTLLSKKWKYVKKRCAGQIGSLLELLQGRLSNNVMTVVTDRKEGLFPLPKEISLRCNCPDWAVMCKHVAAVLYGVGARLDDQPELLFRLRGVDQEELISSEVTVATAHKSGDRRRIADDALADVFGIKLSNEVPRASAKTPRRRRQRALKSTKSSGVAAGRTRTRETRSTRSPTGNGRKPTPPKGRRKRARRPAQSTSPVTGKGVFMLRARFGMSRGQFARLLGVSSPSIGNWEKKPGALHLQPRTLDAWRHAKRLSKRRAWQQLNDG